LFPEQNTADGEIQPRRHRGQSPNPATAAPHPDSSVNPAPESPQADPPYSSNNVALHSGLHVPDTGGEAVVRNGIDFVFLSAASRTTPSGEIDSIMVDKTSSRKFGDIGAHPATRGEGNSPTTSPVDDAADRTEIELALRATPEELFSGEELQIRAGAEEQNRTLVEHDGTLADLGQMVVQQEVTGDIPALSRRLTQTHIEILWTHFEGDPNIICNPCNSVGTEFELPLNTTLDELAAHSEALHPNHCETLVTQTLGMNEEEIERWLEALDADEH